jgi:PAS domain S-box-containing protein
MRDDIVRYVLTAVVKPRSIGALLASQHLPATWIGVVLDGNRHFVARTLEPERNVGALASENLRAALERASEGWFYGATVEGLNVYTSYSRSDFSGWSVAIGIPAAAVEATFRRSLLYVAFFGLALVALGIAIAWILGSKTSRSIASLAVMAGELEAGNRPASSTAMTASRYPSGIAEVDVVKDALVTAHRLIRKHSEERDRVEAKLRGVSERLQLAQEVGNIGTFERDLVTGEINWSTSQEMLYGLVPGSFGGKREDWAQRVHPGDLARVEAEVEHTAQTHAPLNIEFRVIRPDGTVRWIASQARAFADESGKARRLLGVNIDITERKKAEEALLEADRRKDEFLAMLGHELRNPLGVIHTSAQLLALKGPQEPALIQLREMIARQVEHMSRMLDDLLDVSRITRGQIRLKTESCDFTEIVRNIINDHKVHFDESGLRLIADLPDTPLRIMGDPTRLAQIVANLLYNADKFTDRGGAVTLRLVEAPGPTAVLTVSDTGIGIEPDMLKHVFEPFIQSDHSIDRSRGGLGLGLALVKGLVELHGGQVVARSEGLGHGSEFSVSLPLHQRAILPRAETAGRGEATAPQRRILVIEDNAAAAHTLQMYLEMIGQRVEVARTGPDGIEAARRFRPELVLCDIGLPGLDGYEVARRLRRDKELSGGYLIAVSGYGQDGDQRQAREAGFDLHLSKPVDLEKIGAILADLQHASATPGDERAG